MEDFNWTCPHCNRAQVVTKNKIERYSKHIDVGDLDSGPVALGYFAFGCANSNCKKLTIDIGIYSAIKRGENSIYYATDWKKQFCKGDFCRPHPVRFGRATFLLR